MVNSTQPNDNNSTQAGQASTKEGAVQAVNKMTAQRELEEKLRRDSLRVFVQAMAAAEKGRKLIADLSERIKNTGLRHGNSVDRPAETTDNVRSDEGEGADGTSLDSRVENCHENCDTSKVQWPIPKINGKPLDNVRFGQ